MCDYDLKINYLEDFENLNNNLLNILKIYIKNKSIFWIPDNGNAGDSIIALGSYCFFKKNNLNVEIIDFNNIILNNKKFILKTDKKVEDIITTYRSKKYRH